MSPAMRHIKPTFPSEFWIVADLSELHHGRIATSLEQVAEEIDMFERNGEHWRVLCVGDGELGRDVTDEFMRDDDDEEEQDVAGIPTDAEMLSWYNSRVL